MSGPYLYRDEKLLHHGFIVASLIYGAMLQRSVRFPDIGGCTTGIMTGRLGRLGEEGHGRGARSSSLEFEFRNSRMEMCHHNAILFAGSPYPLTPIKCIGQDASPKAKTSQTHALPLPCRRFSSCRDRSAVICTTSAARSATPSVSGVGSLVPPAPKTQSQI